MSNKGNYFFVGHRDAPVDLMPQLELAVERHITEFKVRHFVVGHYGQFDGMAAQAVSKAKLNHPEITLTMLLPYHPAESPIELPPYFDDSLYPFEGERVPRRVAIVRANRFMILHSDYLIVYAVHAASNAKKLLQYARSLKGASAIQITELNATVRYF